MSLLTPLFLVGLIGIALPLWLHRLQTQTNEREQFSSAMFLESTRQRIHVQRKLKYLLLLALRILFLSLLVLAFTRPIWQVPAESFLGEQDTHHVIVVDTSLSMQHSEHMQQALAQAQEIIDSMGGGDQASIYSAAEGVTSVVETTGDRALLRQGLNTLSAGQGRLDLGTMMAALGSLIEDSSATIALHIISDFQQSSQPVRFADLVPRGISGRDISLQTHRVVSTPPANWAVAAISARPAGADVIVQGYHTEAAERTLVLNVNGEVHEQQRQSIPASGQAVYRFEDLDLNPGDNQLEARIVEADALSADDRRYSVLDNSPPAPVLVLTTNPESLSITYLRAALGTAPRPYRADVTLINDLDPRILQRYSWVIIDDIGAINSSLAGQVSSYIEGGGAVFAALGERGQSLGTIPVGGQNLRSDFVSNSGERRIITSIDGSHPALRDSSGWATVNIAQAQPLVPGSEDNVLISLNRDIPFLLERNIGLGKFMLLNGSLDNSSTDLPLRPVFVGFLAETARYLSGEDILQREQTINSTLQLQSSGTGAGQVYDPQGNRLLSLEDTTQARSVELNQSGFYQVFTPEGEVFVAVNPDIRESDLTLMAVQSLQNWQNTVAGTASSQTVGAGNQPVADAESGLAELELWRILLILLVVIVLAESLSGNRHLSYKTGTPA